MFSVKIYQYTQNAGQALVYDEKVDEIEHYALNIWLAKRDGREIYIRPSEHQLLVIEQLK